MRCAGNTLIVRLPHDLKYRCLIIFLTLPHLKTGYFEQFYALDKFIDLWRVFSFFIIFIWYFFIRRKISKLIILFGIIEGYLLVNTVIQKGNVNSCIVYVFSILSIVLLYDMVEDNREAFVESQLFCFELLIYINLLTEIIFPNGLYKTVQYSANWFLGYYNTHTRYFLPALLFAFLYMNYSGKKLRTCLLTGAIFLSALLVWSGGIVITLIAIALIYLLFRNNTKIFNYCSYWMIHLVFFFLVIVMKFQNLFRWLIDDFLGKWRSLEGRMKVWQVEVNLIKKSFLFGYGMEYDDVRRKHYFWAVHSHNQLLEILHQGGIIYLFLLICIIVMVGKKLKEYRNTEQTKIISIIFGGWCIHSLVEPYTTAFLMGMFVIAYYCKNFQRKSNIRME